MTLDIVNRVAEMVERPPEPTRVLRELLSGAREDETANR